MIQELSGASSSGIVVSYDIFSLFANVALEETVDIYVNALYCSHLSTPRFLKNIFKELLLFATESIEFNFNNDMYSQTDGVMMGSPLDPLLANIFAGFQEDQLFEMFNDQNCVINM